MKIRWEERSEESARDRSVLAAFRSRNPMAGSTPRGVRRQGMLRSEAWAKHTSARRAW